jgi:alpha-ribazole phosphatase
LVKLHFPAPDASSLRPGEGRYSRIVTDLPLCAEGVTALKNLTEKISYPAAEKVYSSPLLRCRQTAKIIYPEADIAIVDNLKEYDFGDFENKTAEQLESHIDFFRWTSGEISSPPNGEDSTEFAKRICVGLHQIVLDMMENGIFEASVIMHGGAIMTLLSCTALPRKRNLEWATAEGRGYTVKITPSLYHSSGVIEVINEI